MLGVQREDVRREGGLIAALLSLHNCLPAGFAALRRSTRFAGDGTASPPSPCAGKREGPCQFTTRLVARFGGRSGGNHAGHPHAQRCPPRGAEPRHMPGAALHGAAPAGRPCGAAAPGGAQPDLGHRHGCCGRGARRARRHEDQVGPRSGAGGAAAWWRAQGRAPDATPHPPGVRRPARRPCRAPTAPAPTAPPL